MLLAMIDIGTVGGLRDAELLRFQNITTVLGSDVAVAHDLDTLVAETIHLEVRGG